MHFVKVHEAKTNLSRLIEQLSQGEEVIIARGGTLVVGLI
jgi:antitoxin (DNA-binding transcriptional repressor) of toxin-antitoxin stability system